MTVHEIMVDVLDVRKDEVVLITDAHTGIGHLAAQLAAHTRSARHRHHQSLQRRIRGGARRRYGDGLHPARLLKGIHAEYPEGAVGKVALKIRRHQSM
jgi:hypothetical protein